MVYSVRLRRVRDDISDPGSLGFPAALSVEGGETVAGQCRFRAEHDGRTVVVEYARG